MVPRPKILIALLAALFFFPGCVATGIVHPDFYQKKDRIKVIGVLSPRAEIFRLDIGAIEKMDDWSVEAEKNLLAGIVDELRGRTGLVSRIFLENSLSDEVRSNMAETHGLFEAIRKSMFEHVHRGKRKFEDFDLSLGKEVQELGLGEVDALLIVRARDQVRTTPLKVLQGSIALLSLAGSGALPFIPSTLIAVAGPAMAGAVAHGPSGGLSDLPHVSIALVDARTGAILWYNRDMNNVGYNLTNAPNASKTIKTLLKDLPVGR